MKKLVTMLLVLALSASCFACVNPSTSQGGPNSSSAKPESSMPGLESSLPEVDESEEVVIDFEVEAGAALTFDTTPLDTTGRAKRQETGYTYRGATTTLPTNWNIHTYSSNDATTILGYCEDSLYEFDYNLTMDGYRIVPGMAVDFPEDVTAEFAGTHNIAAEAESGYAYRIQLRDDLKFDNGDEIHAVDFVESVKRLLDPTLVNYRADSLYSGNLKILNAKNYFYNGRTVYLPAVNVEGFGEEITSFDGLFFDASNVAAFESIFGKSDMTALKGYRGYFNVATGEVDAEGNPVMVNIWDKYVGFAGEKRVPMTAEIAADLASLFGENGALAPYWGWVDTEIGYFSVAESTYDTMDFSEVGFFADENDANAFYIVLEQQLTGFYLLYSLSSSMYLVHTETYDECIVESAGVKSSTYGTAADKYVGFGPYKLTSLIPDNSMAFARNPHWYGYALEKNDTYYHTSDITYKVTKSDSLLYEFLAGNTDSYGLQAKDMADYQKSRHTYFTEGDSTWFVALNPNYESLKANQALEEPVTAGNEVNKTVLTIKEFRQAMSFSIDRQAYALALDPLGGTAKALYGNMIISDPEQGIAYRTTTQAKDTILKFWGLYEDVVECGFEDGLYETRDEAIATITGYDLAGAKELFKQAYDIAVADGHITADAAASGKFEVHIEIGQPGDGSSAYYNNGYTLLSQVWSSAVEGTPFEGKLVFTQSEPLGSSGFADFLRDNSVDVLFGVGWTGSALDPYGLMEAYVGPNYQYDPGWDTSAETLDIEIEGYVLRATVNEWGQVALGGTSIQAWIVDENGNATNDYVMLHAGTTCKAEIRLNILAAVECKVLEQYDMIPINLDSSAALKGMKIKYGTEEYVFGVGRGGVKYMTYNYSDAEWAEFVKANVDNNNQLNYK